MKLSDSDEVQRLVAKLHALDNDYAAAEGSGLGVTIVGRYQDESLVAQARPAVLGCIQDRAEEIRNALRRLGVDCNA